MSSRLTAVLTFLVLAAVASPGAQQEPAWKRAGLQPEIAARHALDRLGYGARPGEVELWTAAILASPEMLQR